MWIRNSDTGKWSLQTDQLSKDYYDGLKKDIQDVKLYSNCLSGSLFINIDDFDNIYNKLQIDKMGYFIDSPDATVNVPPRGPFVQIDKSNYDEFYQKYLRENAFTIKNLFTSNRLINTEVNNTTVVDYATTETIQNLKIRSLNLLIDGIRLVEGNRILVKDQTTSITLASVVNADDYFSTTRPVSKYYLTTTTSTDKTYYYYNSDNGIYKYTNGALVKENDLIDYESSYKYNVTVKYGNTNSDKQFHLLRLKNGYFPVEGQNIQFEERHNWVLRHRVDYNNVLDLNFYDLIKTPASQIYSEVEKFTYSIPERLIAVGEFGVIINNQDKINVVNTFNTSTIVNSKYKFNIRSITQNDYYYWVCGDDGTFLKIYKPNLQIDRINLNLYSQLTCVTFYDNLNGFLVGKFNKIYYTTDGGLRWIQLNYPEYESYSYTKVKFKDLNHVYITGTNGLFLELTRDNNNWISYKRQIFKRFDDDDYILVEDIYDLLITNWVTIKSDSYVEDIKSGDFGKSIVFDFKNTVSQYNVMDMNVSSKFLDFILYGTGEFYIGLSMSNSQGVIYSDPNFNVTPATYSVSNFSFYKNNNNSRSLSKQINLPIDQNGNLKNEKIDVHIKMYYNYDGYTDTVSNNFFTEQHNFVVTPTNADILLLPTDNRIIIHDIDNKLYDYGNDFIYFELDKKVGDIRTIDKPKSSSNDLVYIGADKIYYFNLGYIINYTQVDNNYVNGYLFDGPDRYVNRLMSPDKLYFVGNESLLEYIDLNQVGLSNITSNWDPDFSDRYKSKFLFLDYDIASKLNFFTDLGQYRLPNSVTINNSELLPPTTNPQIEFKHLSNQKNWLDYYKDSEKTFEYYTFIGEQNKVEFSTTFSYRGSGVGFTFSSNSITNDLTNILKFAPSLKSKNLSEFNEGVDSILTTTSGQNPQPFTLSPYDVMIYKNIIIFKRDQNDNFEVGDVLRLESDVIDCNLVVNKITYYYKPSGGSFTLTSTMPNLAVGSILEKYIYCFTNFNQNIINNLLTYVGAIKVLNLNKYNSVSDLVNKIDKHTLSIAYSCVGGTNSITISPRFNNKTAYYNLASEIITSVSSNTMDYAESFLNFGYSPHYNIYDYLNNIDSVIFDSSKKLTILPEYYGLPGCTPSNFTNSNISIVSTTFNNKLLFGSDYKFHWESLLLWTFVDVSCSNKNNVATTTDRLLIISKYFDQNKNGYVIEFNKKIELPDLTPDLQSFDIVTRNKLTQISDDLQMLNNIQRSSSSKTINSTFSFTSLENEVKFKFPTDSYLKAMVSDYDIRKNLSAIIYTDYEYQVCMNILNVEREVQYEFNSIQQNYGGSFTNKVTYALTTQIKNDLKVGDSIFVKLNGGSQSSKDLNSHYQGYQTVIDVNNQFVTTSVEYGVLPLSPDFGTISFVVKDAFLNYLPIDLYDISQDKKPKLSIEILPEMVEIEGAIHKLINVDTNKTKLKLVDGLFLQEIEEKYSWFLQADTSPAIIGKNSNGLIWYTGAWKCGRWFSGTWLSGEWLSGDWYGGDWYSATIKPNSSKIEINTRNSNNSLSKWQGGRWFGGTWSGGTWYEGRRYAGDWKDGIWYNGIWNDGDWYGGSFQGGIWVLGNWYGGKFNCDSKLSYWLDGKFLGGDFENGTWYNGQFGNEEKVQARFGTRSINTRTSIWHSGKWLSGEFHSSLNLDEATNLPTVSEIHSLSIWRTGLWLGGDFYGGVAYNIDFRGGTWRGGILEEIQVVGLDAVYPALTATNIIYVNGLFKFNPGDEIHIIDDYRNTKFSPLGSNESPKKYRINKILEDETTSQTALYLNFNLANLNPGLTQSVGSQKWTSIETGLRVVSHFEQTVWKSGLWNNGYFESGTFESGMWMNGVFEGNMGL